MDFVKPVIQYAELWPLIAVLGVACLGVVVEAFLPRERRHHVQVALAAAGLVRRAGRHRASSPRTWSRSAGATPAVSSAPRAPSWSTAPRSISGV